LLNVGAIDPRKPLYPARQTSATKTPPRFNSKLPPKKNSNFKSGSQAVLAAKLNRGRGPGGLAVVPVVIPKGKSGSERSSRSGSPENRFCIIYTFFNLLYFYSIVQAYLVTFLGSLQA
jgi:hypothetical protein